MVRAGCAATTCAPVPRSSPHHRPFTLRARRRQGRRVSSTRHRRFLIGSAAIKNPHIPLKPHAKFFSNRSKIVCLRAHFTVLASFLSNHFSPLPEFLIGSRQLLEIGLTHSQQTRKYFLTAGFLALFSFSCLVKPFVLHSPPSLRRRNPSFSTDAPSAEPEYPRQPWFLDRRAQVV